MIETGVFAIATVAADSETHRTCGTCEKRLSFADFYKDGTDSKGEPKYRRDCKLCYRKTRLSERRAKRNRKPGEGVPRPQRKRRGKQHV